MMRNLIKLVVFFLVLGCDNGYRPSTKDAETEFKKLVPAAKLIQLEKDEDEVAARTFRVSFVYENNEQDKKSGYVIFFIETGEWKFKKYR